MTDSFWTGGSDAYRKALREEYESVFADLRARLHSADHAVSSEIESEIARTKAEYESKLNGIDDAIF